MHILCRCESLLFIYAPHSLLSPLRRMLTSKDYFALCRHTLTLKSARVIASVCVCCTSACLTAPSTSRCGCRLHALRALHSCCSSHRRRGQRLRGGFAVTTIVDVRSSSSVGTGVRLFIIVNCCMVFLLACHCRNRTRSWIVSEHMCSLTQAIEWEHC